jgi:hypothetical protein
MKKQIAVLLVALLAVTFVSQAQVKPIEKDGKYTFRIKDLYFEVDPNVGGRISSFKLEDKELLYTDSSKGNNNWGSTFWPAPQSVWGWPPPDTLDKLPYKSLHVANSLMVTSMPTHNKTNCIFEKIFMLDEIEKSVTVTYSIKNIGQHEIKFGPWQITRVPSGGLTFFPTGKTPSKGMLLPLLKVQNDISWFDYDSAFVSKDLDAVPKLFSDGSDGWLAHVTNDGYLLLFKFTDTPTTMKSPGEDEIEFYTNPNMTYTELEPLGPCTKIAPKTTFRWKVKWYARKLPKNVEVKVGSKSLVKYVNNLLIKPKDY